MTPCPRCGRGIDELIEAAGSAELVECPGCRLRFEVWIDGDVVHVVYDEAG